MREGEWYLYLDRMIIRIDKVSQFVTYTNVKYDEQRVTEYNMLQYKLNMNGKLINKNIVDKLRKLL